MIGDPPFATGAVHVNATWPAPGVATTLVEIPGTAPMLGVPLAVAHAPCPIAVTAATRMNNGTPLVNPSITKDVDGEPDVAVVQPLVPFADVSTTYETTGIPPVVTGASHEKDNRPLPVEMEIFVGAVASVAGVTTDIALGKPLPTELEAVTRKMYVVPLERPVTTNDVAIVVVTMVHEAPPFVERSTM